MIAAVLVLALLTVVSGPDVAVVTRVALGSGRQAAASAACGVAAGCLAWGALTVAGLAAVLAASAEAYTAVKLVGAAYLVFLGGQALWRSSRRGAEPGVLDAGPGGDGKPIVTGLLTSLLNPKIAVFYTGLLPQLVPSGAPVEATLLGLVVVHAVLTVGWLNAYAALLHGARDTMTRPHVRRAVEWITGGVLIGFGVRVAAQTG